MNHTIASVVSLAIAATAFSTTTTAQSDLVDPTYEAAQKVNISGRQRMLSQRMAKAACLMARDVDFSSSFDQLTQSYQLFGESDTALRYGDANLGLLQEKSPEVLEALAKVDEPWAAYKAIVDVGIDNGSIPEQDLDKLDEASLDVLKFMNIAVFKTARAYASVSDDVPLGLTITLDVAGRQRMLTQKAVKDACLMSVSADPFLHADHLAETIVLFDDSLKALRDGYEEVGVMAAPNREIDRKLQEVAGLWEQTRAILDRAAAGEVLSDRDLSRLERLSEPLLQTMNEAVHMYAGDVSS